MNTREVIRLALEDAIARQEELLNAHRHMLDDPYVPEIRELLAAYRKIYERRYLPRPNPLKGARLVGVEELRRQRGR